MEALNVHMQIVNTYGATRLLVCDTERTCKTSRGWWVVWTRLGSMQEQESKRHDSKNQEDESKRKGGREGERKREKEAILIRKASDHHAPGSRRFAGLGPRRDGNDSAQSSGGLPGAGFFMGAGEGTRKLAEGIGVDTRRYVEGLLSLNR